MLTNGAIAAEGICVVIADPRLARFANVVPAEKLTDVPAAFITICTTCHPVATAVEEFDDV